MNPDNAGKTMTPEAAAKEFTIKFTRAELTAIFNVVMGQDYNLANARILIPIIEKIKGPVVQLSNQDFINDTTPVIETN